MHARALVPGPSAWLLPCAALVAACGGTSPTPTTPTQAAPTISVTGTVVNNQTGAPVPLAFLNLFPAGGGPSSHFETDADGRFAVTVPSSATPARTVVGVAAARVAAGLSPRYINHTINLGLQSTRSGVRVDLIEDSPPFSEPFFRQLARDARDTPPGNRTLRPWTRSPSFYIRTTHVESGAPIPPVIVAELEVLFRNSVPELTGGRFNVSVVESGPEARAAADGWVNVLFQSVLPTPGAGGQATVGGNQGTMWLQFDPANPRLAPSAGTACSWATGAAEHEIVHTMGFYHVEAPPGIDKPFQSPDFCSGLNRPEVVRYHAAIVYTRPVGNAHPDDDPLTFLHAAAPGGGQEVVACPVGELGVRRR